MPDAVTEYYRRRERRLQMRADSTGSTGRRNALLRAIRRNRKRELREDDDGNSGWVTLESGNHVLIENSTVVGGAGGSLNGTTLSSAKSTMSGKQKTLAKLNNKLATAQTNVWYSAKQATKEVLRDLPVGSTFKFQQKWSIQLVEAKKTGDNLFELTNQDGKVVSRTDIMDTIKGVPIFTDYMGGSTNTTYTEELPSSSGQEQSWSSNAEYKAAREKAQADYEKALDQVREDKNREISKINKQDYEVRSGLMNQIKAAWDAGNTAEEERLKAEYENVTAEFAALRITADDAYSEKLKELESEYLSVFDADYRYKQISGEHSMEEDGDRSTINPKGLYSNCQRCAVAYELRRRGYDAKVSQGNGGELGRPDNIEKCFQDTETTYISGNDNSLYTNIDQITSLMQSYGTGARALIMVSWREKSYGHALNLEVGSDNKVYVVDSQAGTCEELTSSGKTGEKFAKADDCIIIRTDTATLTSQVEKYAVRNTKKKTK